MSGTIRSTDGGDDGNFGPMSEEIFDVVNEQDEVVGQAASEVTGAEGNREIFLHLRPGRT
jgi:hypothetical protein